MAWLTGWNRRKSKIISGTTAGAQTNYQLQLTIYNGSGTDTNTTVYLGGNCRSDFGDVRFTSSNGSTLLDYWIESFTSGVSAIVWIKIDSIPASPSQATIYVYYDNPSAISLSNGTNTFDFFDDFDGTSLDPKWTVDSNVTTYSVSGSKITITGVSGSWGLLKGIHASFPLANSYIVEVKDFTWSDNSKTPITIRGIGLYPASPSGWTDGCTAENNDSWTGNSGSYETYINTVQGYWTGQGTAGLSGTMQFKFLKDATTSSIYINGTLRDGPDSDTRSTTQIYMLLQAYGSPYSWSGNATFDRILAHKYSSPEPAWSTTGTEEVFTCNTPSANLIVLEILSIQLSRQYPSYIDIDTISKFLNNYR